MKSNTKFSENEGTDIGTTLHWLLADQFALGARMRNCRWNVTGPQGLQRLFASHRLVLNGILDGIAGRAREMGNCRTVVLAGFLKGAPSKAQAGGHPWAAQITAELLAGHEAVIHRLRGHLETACTEKPGGVSTWDFLNSTIEKHENMAGELRAEVAETAQRTANEQAALGGVREGDNCDETKMPPLRN